MGVLDKIKNALFEVEYVEVEEPPKKEKKSRVKSKEKREKNEKRAEKPIAKKIVLPGKKEEKVEELQEEELKDDNFEVRPKDEMIKEEKHEEFKFMDDKDFEVEEPEIVHVLEEDNNRKEVEEDISTYEYNTTLETTIEKPSDNYYSRSVYHNDSKPYGMDNSYNLPVHQYGTYERKEDKSYFKPSPIISPIYGILDKNYKKEDVKEKREVRISSYSRENLNVDDIRDKAYGLSNRDHKDDSSNGFEVEEEEENLLVDLSDRTKPEVRELTMGDALEYFQDLGLEYNVDYVDVSKEKDGSKSLVTRDVENEKTNASSKKVQEGVLEKGKHEEKREKVIEVKDESTGKENVVSDDDNLFDLIDSMYQENE